MTQQQSPSVCELGKPVEFIVELGAVLAFARAAQSTNHEYQAADAVIPPTFLMSVAHWMPESARAAVGFERARLLHGGQEFIFVSEVPRVGAHLVAQEEITDRFEKIGKRGGRMRFAIVTTRFSDAVDGRLVAEMRSTLIEREGRAEA